VISDRWGGSRAPWHDGGKPFNGTMTYVGEGLIGLKLAPSVNALVPA